MKQALVVSLLLMFTVSRISPAQEYEPKVKSLFCGFFKPFMKLSNQKFYTEYCYEPVKEVINKNSLEELEKRETSLQSYNSTGKFLWIFANVATFMTVKRHFKVQNTSTMKLLGLPVYTKKQFAAYTTCHTTAVLSYGYLTSSDLKSE